MSHHEKCGPHEVFVGNTQRDGGSMTYLKPSIRSARLGDVAYDIEGKKLPRSYAPIFISRSDVSLYDILMSNRFSLGREK